MKNTSRTALLVGGALLLGVAAGAVGMLSMRGGDGPYTAAAPAARSMGAGAASTAFVTAVAGNCDMQPVLPSAGDGDGRETLQSKPGAASGDEIASLILHGKEAAAAGHQRDAEVAFLNACRNAAVLKGADPIPLADAMYQLGRHYANVAALGTAKGREGELYPRAERLYSASLEAYRARYGETGEKTRFAEEGLKTVQVATGGKEPVKIAKVAPPPAAAPAPAPVAATPAPQPPQVVATTPAHAPAVAAAPAASPAKPEAKPAAPAEVAKSAEPQRSAPRESRHARETRQSTGARDAAPRRDAATASESRSEQDAVASAPRTPPVLAPTPTEPAPAPIARRAPREEPAAAPEEERPRRAHRAAEPADDSTGEVVPARRSRPQSAETEMGGPAAAPATATGSVGQATGDAGVPQ